MVSYSLLLVGAVMLIALISLYRIFRMGYSFRISEIRKSLAAIGMKHLLLIIFATVFGCAMFFLDYSEADNGSSAVLSLNFAEASNGQDFDGTRYNMSEIISDDVIERAIKEGGFENVTAEQLASCLSVSPLVQGDAYDESSYHIATEFQLTFEADDVTEHLDPRNVVQMVAQAYKNLYIERFTSTLDVLLLDEEVSFDEMEYLDIVKYLDKECSKLKYYMTAMDDENSSFRDSNGNTFSGLALKIDLLKDVQIEENLQAYIVQNSVAKDADAYIGRLEYENILIDYDRQRDLASYTVCNEAIAKYDEKMSRIVLVPTWDAEGEFYMGRTKNGADTLSLKAYNYSLNMAARQKSMEENAGVISAMRTGSTRRADAVETMVSQIYETMIKYAKDARTLAQEYSDTQMNQCISISLTKIPLMSIAVNSAVMAAVCYAAFVLLLIAGRTKKMLAAEPANGRRMTKKG